MNDANTLDERYHQWLTQRAATTGRSLLPAATVALLREGNAGLEVLLVLRNPELRFMGGTWVFPGGRTDPEDYSASPEDYRTSAEDYRTSAEDCSAGAINPKTQPSPPEPTAGVEPLRPPDGDAASTPPSMFSRAYTAAKAAAVRETQEETGLIPDVRQLIAHSHWLPPVRIPQQFATWFFLSPAPPGNVRIDNTENHDWMWISPSEAVRRRDNGTLEIAPPTYVTLLHLAEYASTDEAFSATRSKPPAFYTTVLLDLPDGGQAALWEGDAGYETGAHAEPSDPSDPARQGESALKEAEARALGMPGGRHRLWMPKDQPWRYERSTQASDPRPQGTTRPPNDL